MDVHTISALNTNEWLEIITLYVVQAFSPQVYVVMVIYVLAWILITYLNWCKVILGLITLWMCGIMDSINLGKTEQLIVPNVKVVQNALFVAEIRHIHGSTSKTSLCFVIRIIVLTYLQCQLSLIFLRICDILRRERCCIL